ncbi:hypothetical protein R77567_03896 [Ralstonia sp. LMG 32965]|uniref:Uncharacterized protein n=1 Tax=Ralstonia flatus TaxID=3058601 RepID=A0AAD2F741_9RALS|nr:hypothetical protein R77567_03896 [Ralstonia sp. LMG 32965]CAJ0899826.1 hypothetical protein R77564_04371 [Ralstonia sp. LMG 32965]
MAPRIDDRFWPEAAADGITYDRSLSTVEETSSFLTRENSSKTPVAETNLLWKNNVELCHDAIRAAQYAVPPNLDHIGHYCEIQPIIERDFL